MTSRWLDGLTVSEETSLSLLATRAARRRGRHGSAQGRYLTRLQRWASGRVPAKARSLLDTTMWCRTTLLNTFRRPRGLPRPRHDGALLAYLREAVANRIRMELRRRSLTWTPPSSRMACLQCFPRLSRPVVTRDRLERYERSLAQLDDDDRAAIVGRFEMGYSYDAPLEPCNGRRRRPRASSPNARCAGYSR
jgi:DNA-directed RNA polymerase specialized sigma24 family protein